MLLALFGPFVADDGMTMSLSGCAKRCSTAFAWLETADAGPRARLTGRWERGSADVGIDSGMFSDMTMTVAMEAFAQEADLYYHERNDERAIVA